MLDIEYIIITVIGIIFLLVGIEYESTIDEKGQSRGGHKFWHVAMIMMSSIAFWAIAYGSLNIQSPAVTNINLVNGSITNGYSSYGLEYSLIFFFGGIAIIENIYIIYIVFIDGFYKAFKKAKLGR